MNLGMRARERQEVPTSLRCPRCGKNPTAVRNWSSVLQATYQLHCHGDAIPLIVDMLAADKFELVLNAAKAAMHAHWTPKRDWSKYKTPFPRSPYERRAKRQLCALTRLVRRS